MFSFLSDASWMLFHIIFFAIFYNSSRMLLQCAYARLTDQSLTFFLSCLFTGQSHHNVLNSFPFLSPCFFNPFFFVFAEAPAVWPWIVNDYMVARWISASAPLEARTLRMSRNAQSFGRQRSDSDTKRWLAGGPKSVRSRVNGGSRLIRAPLALGSVRPPFFFSLSLFYFLISGTRLITKILKKKELLSGPRKWK